MQVSGAVHRVAIGAGIITEAPALLREPRLDHGHADNVVELFELARDQRARGPRANQRHIEVIAAGFGFEAAAAVRAGTPIWRYPIPEA